MPLIERIAGSMPPEIAIVVVAMLPVLELRGSIPLGLALGVNPIETYFLSLFGNMLLMPAIYHLLDPVTRKMRSSPLFSRYVERMYENTHAKSTQVKKYGFWGLVVFVAVPLPGTGAVTGVMAASVLRMAFWPTMWALLLGNIIAGIAVMSISLTGMRLFGL